MLSCSLADAALQPLEIYPPYTKLLIIVKEGGINAFERVECFMCFTEMMANCIQSYMTECLFGL